MTMTPPMNAADTQLRIDGEMRSCGPASQNVRTVREEAKNGLVLACACGCARVSAVRLVSRG